MWCLLGFVCLCLLLLCLNFSLLCYYVVSALVVVFEILFCLVEGFVCILDVVVVFDCGVSVACLFMFDWNWFGLGF